MINSSTNKPTTNLIGNYALGQQKHNALILGNGPSLRGFNLHSLIGFDVFGMNAAYRYWRKINWYPQYYACLDLILGSSHQKEIIELINNSDGYGIKLFLLRDKLINEICSRVSLAKVMNFDQLCDRYKTLKTDYVTTGSHTCAWASIIGYKNIYLLGIDCNYVEIIPLAEKKSGHVLEITKNGKNPNYFFDEYQQVGDKYNVPNVVKDVHLNSWRNISNCIDTTTIKILNANPASKVDAFPFISEKDFKTKISAEWKKYLIHGPDPIHRRFGYLTVMMMHNCKNNLNRFKSN